MGSLSRPLHEVQIPVDKITVTWLVKKFVVFYETRRYPNAGVSNLFDKWATHDSFTGHGPYNSNTDIIYI
jgi:hypothetical protein